MATRLTSQTVAQDKEIFDGIKNHRHPEEPAKPASRRTHDADPAKTNETFAAGLAAGGRKPLILIQNTGMMESGDSNRGWLLGLNIPVVMMVGYRGWTRHGVTTDTAATYTERFLMAFGLNYYLIESDVDADRIGTAFAEAERTRRPVVVLVGDEYHGFNR